MSYHPINLAVRFLLELAGLAALGYWGWRQGSGLTGYALTVALPLIAAVLWGVFNVPGDPSRSGGAPVAVPGMVRLILELTFFTAAVIALYHAGAVRSSWILGIVAVTHYVLSYDRILWLLER
jgi:hypothetical protein